MYLESIGRNPNFSLSDSSSSEDEYSEGQDEDRPSDEDVKNPAKPVLQEDPSVNCISVMPHSEKNVNQQPEKLVGEQEHQTPSVQSESSFPPQRGEGKNVPELDVNSSLVLDILREVDFNWFSFVVVLEPKFQKHGYSQEVFDQFLCDFASQLQNLGLSVDEFNLVEQSCTAYLSDVMQKEMRIQEIVEEVSSGEEPEGNDGDEELDENKLLVKLKLIKDKGKKRAKDEIEMRGLNGKRKSSKSAQSVLSRHPDIGEVMEQIVREADVGADKWRRTGVYTFTGDTKTEKRMTFKRLQERLSSHYGEKFSYGTVLHLCVHRNKRRISSRRYKGVANIKYQRARKGFNLKFNPDAKWSRSLYKCLD